MTLAFLGRKPIFRGRGTVAALMFQALVLAACAAQRTPIPPPVSLDPRPRAAHDLPGASIDLLVQPSYPVGARVEVEIEVWSWGATIRGPIAAEVRTGPGRASAEGIRRWDVAQAERSVPANDHGRLVLAWDGRDGAGQPAPAGTYWVALVFEIERPGRGASRQEVGSAIRLTQP